MAEPAVWFWAVEELPVSPPAERPAVLACTLLPYDPQFELGATLKDAARPVPLNHPHCARFCVIGGALCSAG